MTLPTAVQVSPRHHVSLDEDYMHMIARPPRHDFVVRTLAKRTAGEMALMTGELVIAGEATRDAYPLAVKYPLHFRKTYYPGRLHADPSVEFDRHTLASTMIPVPPPIGCTRDTFRSCLLPGRPFDRLCGLDSEPDESNIALAQAQPMAAVAGLWRLAEDAYGLITHLQAQGFTHGDAHLHNFVVCPSPVEVLPIDFERALVKDAVDEDHFRRRCEADQQYLLKLAIYLQCALGGQRGPLALASMERLDTLVTPAATFRRVITERTFAGPVT